jgi:hypothetical protein
MGARIKAALSRGRFFATPFPGETLHCLKLPLNLWGFLQADAFQTGVRKTWRLHYVYNIQSRRAPTALARPGLFPRFAPSTAAARGERAHSRRIQAFTPLSSINANAVFFRNPFCPCGVFRPFFIGPSATGEAFFFLVVFSFSSA